MLEIRAGMRLVEIQGEDIVGKSLAVATRAIEAAGRPLRLTFHDPIALETKKKLELKQRDERKEKKMRRILDQTQNVITGPLGRSVSS